MTQWHHNRRWEMQGSCAQEEGKNSSSQTAAETQIFTLQQDLLPTVPIVPEEVKKSRFGVRENEARISLMTW